MQIKLNNSTLPLLLPRNCKEVCNGTGLYKDLYHKREYEDLKMFQSTAEYSYGNIIVAHIKQDDAMVMGDKDALIKNVRDDLEDNQGIIKVETGTNPRGFDYVYSIVKTYHKELLNVNYCARINIKYGDEYIEINGSFFEAKTTGVRGAMGMNLAWKADYEEDPETHHIKGWAEDPYDPEFDKGCCMIMPEREGLDGLFPGDPLSQARELVVAVTEDSYYKTTEEIEEEHKIKKDEKKNTKDKETVEEHNDNILRDLFSKDAVRAGKYKVEIEGEKKLGTFIPKSIINKAKGEVDASIKGLGDIKDLVSKKNGETKLKIPYEIPDDFKNELNKPLPDELPGWGKREYMGYGKHSFAMKALVLTWPVSIEESLSFDKKKVIEDYHSDMDDNVGLICVRSGYTRKGTRYVYAIRKIRCFDEEKEVKYTDYTLNFNIRINGIIYFINGSFHSTGEVGGTRYPLDVLRNGSSELKLESEEWQKDPYDETFTKGFLMDWTEDEKYDGMFPDHPLSELRRFVNYVIENN